MNSNRKSVSHGFLAGIFGALDRYGVVVDLISTSEVHVSMAIEDGIQKKILERVVRELQKSGSVSSLFHPIYIISFLHFITLVLTPSHPPSVSLYLLRLSLTFLNAVLECQYLKVLTHRSHICLFHLTSHYFPGADVLVLQVTVHRDMAILSLVGKQMRNLVGIAGRMFTTLGQGNVNIEMISQGANEINISCVIDGRDAVKALNMIHQSCLQIRPEGALGRSQYRSPRIFMSR